MFKIKDKWKILLKGDENTVYKGGIFEISVNFPEGKGF
jgi:ubiquitin-protein ligase